MRACLLFFGALLTLNCLAESALRHEGEDYREAEVRTHGDDFEPFFLSRPRVSFSRLDLDQLSQFSSLETLSEHFGEVRDARFLDDPSYSVLRRPSWMYPDDGCWIRAQLMNYRLNTITNRKMHKIFIYGNLRVSTRFNPSGMVRWWFHVVPIARVGNKAYVYDPAINASSPMELEDWVLSQVGSVRDAEFEICHPDTYGTNSRCKTPPRPNYSWVRERQAKYLSLERKRLRNLDLDAFEYLGNSPPWLD